MDIGIGDRLILKKKHPCGSFSWIVLRVGMDFRLRCEGCGREVWLTRADTEKRIAKIEKTEI